MKRFNAFVKDVSNVSLPAKTMMEVVAGSSFRVDLLGTVISTIKVLKVSDNVNTGDIIIVYDNYGYQVYIGVINNIENEVISCQQMSAFFNDIFPLNLFDTTLSVEQMFKKGVEDYYCDNAKSFYDPKACKLFSKIDFIIESETFNNYMFDVNATMSLEKFVFEMYLKNQIKLTFEINQLSERITIRMAKCLNSNMKIGDNTSYSLDFNVITETQEATRLIIFDNDGVYRTSYYTTINGITDNPNNILRQTQIKTKIVYSSEDLEKIKYDNLNDEIYNHSIKLSLIQKGNTILNPIEIINGLGSQFEVWRSGKVYHSLLTGYDLNFDGAGIPIIALTFGKVRNRLEFKL